MIKDIFKVLFRKEPRLTDWDHWFLKSADHWASRSKDPSSKVGAVIADGKTHISGGMNGFARGVKDSEERLQNKIVKYPLMLHAELNAVLFAKRDLTGMTLYCTHPPCASCAAVICQVGIKKVVYREPTADFATRWDPTLTLSQFREAGVEVVEVPSVDKD